MRFETRSTPRRGTPLVTTLAAAAAVALAGAAHAQETLYALAGTSGGSRQLDIYEIDVTTGATTRLTNTNADLRGLAIDPDTGDMYVGLFNGGIAQIDPDTGVITPIGGSINFVALTFTPAGDLFGIRRARQGADVYEIDTANGNATLLATDPTDQIFGPGLASDPAGDLFASWWRGNVYRVNDPATSYTQVGVLDASSFANQAMAFNQAGDLFVAEHPCCNPGRLWRLDPATFQSQGSVSTGIYVRGLAFGNANTPPTAACVVEQLSDIGDEAMVAFSAAGSSDNEDAITELTFDWTIDDGVNVITASGFEIEVDLGYGDYIVTLTVTDTQGATATSNCDVSINPASLSVFACEKVEVKFCLGDADSDSSDDDSSADDHSSGCTSDRVKIKGEIGLPMGVDFAEVDPLALVLLDVAGTDFLGVGAAALTFDVSGGDDEHWKYRDEAGTLGITKLDINWKGARFKYKESGFPVQLETELITSSETVLTMSYKMGDIGGPFSVSIDGTVLHVDADGVVTSGQLPPEAIEVKKAGKKITVTLPFPLVEDSFIIFTSALSGEITVADHYTSSLGQFKLEARSGDTLPSGAESLPREVGLMMGIGAPLYPGACDLTPDELKVHSRKWKAKR